MKKIIVALIMFCTVSFVFARPIFQQDFEGNGFEVDYDYSAFSQDTNNLDSCYTPLIGVSELFLWEFNSSSESNFHFYTGFETGCLGVGIPLSLAAGFTYKLKDFGPVLLELNTTVQAGIYYPLLYESAFGFEKFSADVVVMKPSRRGIYGGIGITDNIIQNLNCYVDYGVTVDLMNVLGCRLVAGYRF